MFLAILLQNFDEDSIDQEQRGKNNASKRSKKGRIRRCIDKIKAFFGKSLDRKKTQNGSKSSRSHTADAEME